jgi:hypothetical protein
LLLQKIFFTLFHKAGIQIAALMSNSYSIFVCAGRGVIIALRETTVAISIGSLLKALPFGEGSRINGF